MAQIRQEPALILALLLAPIGLPAQQYIVSTVAGGIPPPTPVAALQASIEAPSAIALDAAGNLYFTSVNCVFKLDSNGIVNRVAGTSQPGYSGDNGPAVNAQLNNPSGLVLDPNGNLYIADTGNARVRKVSPSGIISTYAGTGVPLGDEYPDPGPATSIPIAFPVGLALDSIGNLYVSDWLNLCVWKVSAEGITSSFAGNHSLSSAPPGNTATSVSILFPSGLAVDAAGNVYIVDTDRSVILKVSPTGFVSTVAGPAVGDQTTFPVSVAIDAKGNIYFGTNSTYVGEVSAAGDFTVVAGTSAFPAVTGFSGDGGPATSAQLCSSSGVALDPGGNLYFADSCNNRIRKVSSNGVISTIVGNGTAGYSGDGGPAASAQLSASFTSPTALATDTAGNLYIADGANSRVRLVNSSGVISTVAGTGSPGFSGDGGAATSAQIYSPASLAIDQGGNLYISDLGSAVRTSGIGYTIQNLTSRIRKVSPTGTISTVAGTGADGDTGDGGPAINAQINAGPLAVDQNGNLYFADDTFTSIGVVSSHIRKISASGLITTFAGVAAGSGAGSYLYDIPALTAYIPPVSAMTTDAAGNLFFASGDNPGNIVEEILSPTGLITDAAGTDQGGDYGGDGGPAVNARLSGPKGVAVDTAGNLYIADTSNGRIRKVSPDGIITTIAGNGSLGYSGDGGLALNAQILPGSIALGANGQIYFTDANAVRVLTPLDCKYAASTTSLEPPAAGASFSVTISTGPGCGWSIATVPDWITVSGPLTFSSTATASFVVAPNSGGPRAVVLFLAGVEVAVNQSSDVLLLTIILNSANYGGSPVPGSIASVFGSFLLTNPLSASALPIPDNLGGLSLQLSSAPNAPLLYASSGQLNVQIPWELAGESGTTATVTINGQTSAALFGVLTNYSPTIYTTNGQGTGQGAILDANYRLVDASNPAIAGSTVVQIFCTGLGAVTNQPATGAASPSNPLAETMTQPQVSIGGFPATVQFSGLTPGFVGLYQVNVLVPAQVAGMGYVTVAMDDSNIVVMAVK